MGEHVEAVVIHRDQPERCLTTVADLLASERVALHVTVVDNGSTPAAVTRLRGALPDGVDLVETGANLGFGPGANVGLRRWLDAGEADWAVVCPHDAHPEPDCIARLVEALRERPDAGLACADVGDDALPLIDDKFGGISKPTTRGEGWVEVGYPHGTLMVIRRACAAEVGLFDERYFAYCEETDLAIRAAAAGWRTGMVWGARVTNTHLSSTLALNEYLKLRNSIFLVRTHHGRWPALVRFVWAIGETAWLELRPARRSIYYDRAGRLAALRDVLRGRLGPPPEPLAHRPASGGPDGRAGGT